MKEYIIVYQIRSGRKVLERIHTQVASDKEKAVALFREAKISDKIIDIRE